MSMKGWEVVTEVLSLSQCLLQVFQPLAVGFCATGSYSRAGASWRAPRPHAPCGGAQEVSSIASLCPSLHPSDAKRSFLCWAGQNPVGLLGTTEAASLPTTCLKALRSS